MPTGDAMHQESSPWHRLNYGSRHEVLSSRRVPETGHWIIESLQFKRWVRQDRNNENNVLWCLGRPGSGKSMLTSVSPFYFIFRNSRLK